VPALGPTRELHLPQTQERTLPSGLTVLAIPRPSVPLVEVRLRIPFAEADLASSALLTQTLFSGTPDLSTVDIAAELQSVGGALGAGVDPDRLMVNGNALSAGLPRLLDILAGVLNQASYPADEVATERDRLVDRIQVAQSQPSHLARVALLKRVYGGHPYAVQTPDAADVKEVAPERLRSLHAERMHPGGAILVLVGDFAPDRVLDTVEAALSTWDGGGGTVELPPVPSLSAGPLTLVDRPGSVQSSLRLALPAVGRTHPDHAALQLANLLFGGYFSSRWVENIREDKGYTYGPHSAVEHSIAGSLQLGMSTQAGLAGLASTYAGYGLRLDYLSDYSARLAAATRDDVAAAAARYLAPAKAVTVVLGDAEVIESSVAALAAVQRETLPAAGSDEGAAAGSTGA
jgi:predicted Zn-dependent peptidase